MGMSQCLLMRRTWLLRPKSKVTFTLIEFMGKYNLAMKLKKVERRKLMKPE